MKKQLFSMFFLLLLVAISVLATGCAAPGLTKSEVHQRHVDTVSVQQLQFQDAVDAWLMIDRPSRASRMYVR